MRFIIEFDGAVGDVASAHYRAHCAAVVDIGWSRLDQATFWRSIRTRGQEAEVLPGARPLKVEEYRKRFDVHLESSDVVSETHLHSKVENALATLAAYGECSLVTAGTNVAARREVLEREGVSRFVNGMNGLSRDPRRRPAELLALTAGDQRSVVVAASDSVVRSAGQVGLFVAGIASGECTVRRLHQAGASIVFRELHELADALRNGAGDLIRAGLLPPPLAGP